MYHPVGGTADAMETFGFERNGAFAEFSTAESVYACKVDSPLSSVELASFPCAFSTTEDMIQRAGDGNQCPCDGCEATLEEGNPN